MIMTSEIAVTTPVSGTDENGLCGLKSQVNGGRMMETLRHLSGFVKMAGTASERESLEGLRAKLADLGFTVSLIEHDAYISIPGEASLHFDARDHVCITHSMAVATGPGGLTAPLIDAGTAKPSELSGLQVAGKIVLVDGIATPEVSRILSTLGAAGIIHVSPHEHIHEMCISPIWGSPSITTMRNLPSCAVISVSEQTGAEIRERLNAEGGDTEQATIHAQVDTGWRKTPLLVAEMDAEAADPQNTPFVLLSGHHDTWHYGVMDNGSANATMVEIAGLAASRRRQWKRGLRICIWSGHSQGRYSGSAWYADENWADFNKRCAAHVNIDSPGGIGAENLRNTGVMSTLRPLAARAILDGTGQVLAGKPKVRSADESLQGIGVPSMFGSLSGQVLDPASKMRNALGWWWHTPEDLIDKIDEANLVRDAKIVLECLWRLLSDDVLPIDVFAPIDSLRSELFGLQESLGDRFDLKPLLAKLEETEDRLRKLLEKTDPIETNSAIMRASRELVLLEHSHGDRFVHEPALNLPAWPVLEPLRALAAAAPDTDIFRFAKVDAVRARNRIGWHIDRIAHGAA